MKKLLLFVPIILLFVSCNNSPTANKTELPANTQAKSVQSSPAQSTQVTKPYKKYFAGITKHESGIIQKSEAAKNL